MAYITLNIDNFFNNLDIITHQTKSKDKIALVLKDNAYGHGLLEVSMMAQKYGIKRCVVQNSDEAEIVKDFFDYILVLSDFPTYYNPKIRYTINSLTTLKKFPKNTKVELKVDTGMHRNGIMVEELSLAFQKIKEQGLELEAVFTHHRSADEVSSEWYWQNSVFKKVKQHSIELAKKFQFQKPRFHSSNSASLFRFNNFDEDMARVGIAVYGCLDMPKLFSVDSFKPVLSLYASKISSRKLKNGSRIGYGATYKVKKECIVTNYDFGYGSGFLRVNSNNYITPQGYKIIGRVSMDNSSFLSECDELLIFDNAIKASKFAKTISYEVLTSLKTDISRKIITDRKLS